MKSCGCALRCERGATAIEYALIAGVLALGIAAALNALSGEVNGLLNTVAGQFPQT